MKLSKEEIKKIIPYDDPFLFVDQAEIIGENEIEGYFQTKPEDYYFKGHFVNFPMMPGVLIVEAIAQLSTILIRKKIKNPQEKHVLAYQVRGVNFYKPIFSRDKIKLKAEILSLIEDKIARVFGSAFVGEELKAEARFICAIVDKKEFEEKYK